MKLLIIAHTPSLNTEKLAHAILAGACSEQSQELNTTLLSPFDCNAETVLTHDGIILFTTENFGTMSGALKDFFERIYYPCREAEQGNDAKPYALIVRAGLDGSGTQSAVEKIIIGLKWKKALPNLLCKGEYIAEFEQQCRELGMSMAAGLTNEIF